MAHKMVKPLQPKEFFAGTWKGEGELSPHPLLRWLMPPEQVRFSSRPIWLSDTVWVVRERFEFSSGDVIARTMFVEIVGLDRLHVTADDMPLGADIILHEKGFRFTPYYQVVPLWFSGGHHTSDDCSNIKLAHDKTRALDPQGDWHKSSPCALCHMFGWRLNPPNRNLYSKKKRIDCNVVAGYPSACALRTSSHPAI